MDDDDKSVPVQFIPNPLSPDVYATEAAGFFVLNGVVYITFETVRLSHDETKTISRVVIGRLVMPLSGAQNLALGLFDFLKQRGLMPETPNPKAMQ